MIYSVENKRSGEFHFCKGLEGISRTFPVLLVKTRTIQERFKKLKKEKAYLSFTEWGFNFKATNKLI